MSIIGEGIEEIEKSINNIVEIEFDWDQERI